MSVMSAFLEHSFMVHKSIHACIWKQSPRSSVDSPPSFRIFAICCVLLPHLKYVAFGKPQQLVFLNPYRVLQPPPKDVLGKEFLKWYMTQSVTQVFVVHIQTLHSKLQDDVQIVPLVASVFCAHSAVLCTALHKSLCYVICSLSCLPSSGKLVGFSYS